MCLFGNVYPLQTDKKKKEKLGLCVCLSKEMKKRKKAEEEGFHRRSLD